MSRTDLDATTLANSLRMRAGDGSIEWVSEPIQASVLLDIADMLDENARLKQELEAVGTAAYLYGRDDLQTDNAKLREQTELLVTLLRNDCDIEASWDGLRRFWSIELTEDGCLMRDRACKAEADNAKLRELVQDYHRYEHEDCYACRYINECRADESGRCIAPMRLGERYRELGVEATE